MLSPPQLRARFRLRPHCEPGAISERLAVILASSAERATVWVYVLMAAVLIVCVFLLLSCQSVVA